MRAQDCARGFGGSSSSASGQSSLPGGRTQGITGDALLNAISGGLFDGLSHADAYRRIIDSYRLRVEDEYVFEQSNKGIYAGEDPNPEFRDFLNKAETKKLLPAWWSRAKRAECESLSTDSRGDSYLGHAVEKHDIQEKYADSLMPLKIRVLAEKIYGRRIGV